MYQVVSSRFSITVVVFTISYFGVDVVPHTPADLFPENHELSVSSGEEMK